jgi:hypothetical protein
MGQYMPSGMTGQMGEKRAFLGAVGGSFFRRRVVFRSYHFLVIGVHRWLFF